MKKRIRIHNGTTSQKWRVIFTVLTLIFSLILVSATGAGNSTDSGGSTGANLEQEMGSNSTNNLLQQPENITDKDSRDDQDNIEKVGNQPENNSSTDTSDSQEITEEKIKQENNKSTETSNISTDISDIDTNHTDTDNISTGIDDTDSRDSIDSNESTKKNLEQNQEDNSNNISTNNQEDTKGIEENQTAEEEAGNNNTSKSNLDSEEKENYTNQSSGDTRSITEQNSRVCNGARNPINEKSNLEVEIKVCNWTRSLEIEEEKIKSKITACNKTNNSESKETTPEKLEGLNWTDSPENETVPEIKPEISSWNILKLLLEYPYFIHSYYTTEEKVEVRYDGPEILKDQSVNIYLIKKQNFSFPEAATNSSMDDVFSFEDIVNKDTESYIEIPSTLNAYGDLSPLYLGPLPAGNYWLVITLAGNKTGTAEQEEKILLANNFEVLKYEMEASIPASLVEGEDLEVNLTLKNASAQGTYTYWAVLIKEDAYRVNINNSSSEIKTGTNNFLKGLETILGIESTNYESEFNRNQIKNEIQSLIGESNGTVSIGEENQSNLSLTTLGLPPGDYLLFAGAYEKDNGLTGIVQKELTIYEAEKEDSDSKSYSSEHNSEIPPLIRGKASSPEALETEKSILETVKTFGLEDLQSKIQGNALAKVIKYPPKTPSFLLGFTATLLIGLLMLKMRNRN